MGRFSYEEKRISNSGLMEAAIGLLSYHKQYGKRLLSNCDDHVSDFARCQEKWDGCHTTVIGNFRNDGCLYVHYELYDTHELGVMALRELH